MTYTHRNGETDPPSVDGAYWFSGNRLQKWRRASRGEWTNDAGSLLSVIDGEILPYGGYWTNGNCLQTEGQWWGPVVAPWEEER